MTLASPLSLHANASRMVAAMACVGSGAGIIPSVRANFNAAEQATPQVLQVSGKKKLISYTACEKIAGDALGCIRQFDSRVKLWNIHLTS